VKTALVPLPSVYDRYVRGGQLDAGVVGLYRRVVPALYLAEEDVRDDCGREAERLRDALQVVGDDDRAEDCRDVEYLSGRALQVLVLHR